MNRKMQLVQSKLAPAVGTWRLAMAALAAIAITPWPTLRLLVVVELHLAGRSRRTAAAVAVAGAGLEVSAVQSVLLQMVMECVPIVLSDQERRVSGGGQQPRDRTAVQLMLIVIR